MKNRAAIIVSFLISTVFIASSASAEIFCFTRNIGSVGSAWSWEDPEGKKPVKQRIVEKNKAGNVLTVVIEGKDLRTKREKCGWTDKALTDASKVDMKGYENHVTGTLENFKKSCEEQTRNGVVRMTYMIEQGAEYIVSTTEGLSIITPTSLVPYDFVMGHCLKKGEVKSFTVSVQILGLGSEIVYERTYLGKRKRKSNPAQILYGVRETRIWVLPSKQTYPVSEEIVTYNSANKRFNITLKD